MSLVAWALALLAASPPEARFLDDLARRALSAGRYADAVHIYGELAARVVDPAIDYNLAVAADLAGDRGLARDRFERFLRRTEGQPARAELPPRTRIEARLRELESRLALIDVISSPPGARLTVDGLVSPVPDLSPAILTLKPGRHVVRLDYPGYETVTATVTAVVGARRPLMRALRRAQGTLEIRTRPGARVQLSVEGETTRSFPANARRAVDARAYRFRVEAPGFRPFEAEAVVEPGAMTLREVVLVPEPPARSRLLVRTRSGVGQVRLDGQLRAETPLVLIVDPGPHRVEIERDGRSVWSIDVEVKAGRNLLIEAAPIASSP
ncbi:MAG: PEGA domain-containing protein [Myxococcota bacterium]